MSRRWRPARFVICGDVAQCLSQSSRQIPARPRDGSCQRAIAGTHFDHMKYRGRAESLPHLLQLTRNQRTENRVTGGRRTKVRAYSLVPRCVKASMRRVQTGLHEPGKRNAPARLHKFPDLLLKRRGQCLPYCGWINAASIESPRRATAIKQPLPVSSAPARAK